MRLTAVVLAAEEGGFIAYNPVTGTADQGETVKEAVDNLRKGVELYLDIEAIASADVQIIRSSGDETEWVRKLVEDGLASGMIDQEAEEVLDEIISEDPDLRS